MNGKKYMNWGPGTKPNEGDAKTVVDERGRKDLSPGTKGGENLKPDRHYEHKQHAFDSYCKRSIKHEALNAYTQLRKRSQREISLSELPEDAMTQHYSGYIAALSMRTSYDANGYPRTQVDKDLRRRLETKLIVSILNFDLT